MAISIFKFFENLKSKKVAFIGTGVSHKDTIKLFLKKGVSVTVLDKKDKDALGEVYTELCGLGAQFVLGDKYLDSLCDFDVVFRTPGMNFFNEQLVKARDNGVVVTSEMEVFFKLCPCKIYAVTGSDGKTTTTTLISEFFKGQGKTVHLGGNIGKALLPIIDEIDQNDVAVVELSSFQLISMRQSPDVAVITNIAPNHLDVHKDMDEYIDAKKNLLLHQDGFSKSVLNMDNELTNNLESIVRGKVCKFSRNAQPKCGAFLDKDGNLCYSDEYNVVKLFNKDIIKLPGIHNVENYLTAITAVWGEVDVSVIENIARNFGGVEHRIELVRELHGVRWYNDSIASSPTRTIAGLNSFNQKIIVIAGGYDKKIPYEPLAPKLVEKVKTLILMGDTAPKIEQAVKSCEGFLQSDMKILHADDMKMAVQLAYENATDGDVVTLSPASASFDKYPNFEVRGKDFKNIVNNLK